MHRFVRNAEVTSSSLVPSTSFFSIIDPIGRTADAALRGVLRRLSPLRIPALFPVLALLAAGCGSSPLAPTDTAPTVTLSVQLYGHISQRPIVGELVRLDSGREIWTPGGPQPLLLPQRTDSQGRASWQVPPGHVYPMRIRGGDYFQAVTVVNDSGWLLSFPE